EDKKARVSGDEAKAAKKVESASDVAAKLKAAGEFVKKYPSSSLRPQVAYNVASKIMEIQDPAQRITSSENYLSIFNDAREEDLINPILRSAYIDAKRYDDAFQITSAWIERNPDDVGALTQMAVVGADQARLSNQKYIEQSRKYGAKAIELLEANKKPADVDDAQWSQYKTRSLPQLYQAMGVIAMVTGNIAEAKTNLQKAVSLNPSDPFAYVFLGSMLNEEYQKMVEQYRNTPAGAAQNELLQKINAQLDQVIDAYAHAVALSEGRPEYQKLREELMQDLENYYKFRHKGSTEGLQQLINKYKSASTSQ
ncbi:MAG TPA: hypothetical protein VD966_02330, partial [Pyrinomonadaceae bacterium]|nr:hypothetical protein [Pyrinomonadaceae bacterium]